MHKLAGRARVAYAANAAVPRAAARARTSGAVAVAVLFMGSTLLTPMYDLYRHAYRISPLSLSLLYAAYVIGNLAALLLLGRLSDQVGRRSVVLGGAALAAVSALLFLAAGGQPLLFAGRVVSGCAVGLGSAAATAWITEAEPAERRERAASTMTVFNYLGLALGTVLAGVLVQYAPWPLRLPFVVYLALVLAVAVMAVSAPETLARRAGPLSLKPRLGVPAGLRRAFLAPAAAGFTAMAVVGFYAALGPTMISGVLGVSNRAQSGLVVAGLFAIAGLGILATRSLKSHATLRCGLATALPGLLLLAAVQVWPSWDLVLLASLVCGVAAGLSYRGGLAVTNELAPPERRAELASAYFVCCFMGNALPVIGVGALSQAAGATVANTTFAVALSLLGVPALAFSLMVSQPPKGSGESAPR